MTKGVGALPGAHGTLQVTALPFAQQSEVVGAIRVFPFIGP